MSRYKIRVRQADSLHGTFACDAVDVDGGGDLHVNRLCGGGGSLTIARFQHGHWSSYELELNGDAEPDTDACAEAPVDAEALPEVGETVHVWRKSGKIAGCCPMRVTGRCATDSGVALALAGPLPWSPEFEQLLTSIHDETRTEHASWHWPCEGSQVAEPKPDAPALISVTFNVSSPVLNERWLRESVDRALRQATSVAAGTPYRR